MRGGRTAVSVNNNILCDGLAISLVTLFCIVVCLAIRHILLARLRKERDCAATTSR
jgi:hypothetical protein